MHSDSLRLERTFDTDPTTVWDLWTTAEGIESWWSPDGFGTTVKRLDLRPGGELVYAMTATAPRQIEFMKSAGMPLTTESRKMFTEVVPVTRIVYRSIIDFVPDHPPYEHLTTVDLKAVDDGVRVTMLVEPLHDTVWTERLLAGRNNELDNLSARIDEMARGECRVEAP